MFSLPNSWFTIAITVISMTGLFMLDETTKAALFFDKTAVMEGELWRLFTGHFVHLTAYHLLSNTIGLLLIWRIFKEHLKARLLVLIIVTLALLISLQLSTPWTDTSYFFGFSGVLHGLLAYGLLAAVRTKKRYWVFWVGLFAKVAYEQSTYFDTTSQLSLIDAPVAVDVHLAGVIAAVLLSLVARVIGRCRTKPKCSTPPI